MKKILHLIICVLVISPFIGCVETQEIPVESVSLSQATAEMIIGETAQLIATVLPSNAADKTILWTSSKQSVATITNNGLVTAVAEGVSTVTASSGGKSATCLVTVSKGFVAVTSVTLNKTELSLVKGQSETLMAIVRPDDATDKTVVWDISNTSVATVDSNGKVTAVAGGDATITAKAGNQVATCALTVTVPVESVSINYESITLEEESSTTLVATVKPDDATDKSVTWSSSSTSIAKVDQNGKVTAVKEGSATITAIAGDKLSICSVTVKKKVIAVTSVTLNKTALSLDKGQSETLTAIVKPDNATDKSVTWSSSNTAIATVDANGKVTAVAGGSATISAKAGEKSATCAITVTVPVESITLDKSSVTLEKNGSITLTATVKPDDATNKTVTWSSSSTQVATVDNNGKVTAVNAGEATITAKAGGKSATCIVTVIIPVESITLNKSSVTLEKNSSINLSATVKPNNATNITVTWSSSNTQVATVDNNGKVKAINGGEATITAKAGSKSATCAVTVTVPVESITLDKSSVTLEKNESISLSATVKPDDATNKTVTWSSSNTQVATVDNYGRVTAVDAGEATITAKAGGKSATCHVYVNLPYVPVSGVKLNKNTLELKKGSSETLTATVSPQNATDKAITWSSTNEGVAKVNQDGRVTAIDSGAATIIATVGQFSAECKVTVVVPVSGVTLNTNSLTMKKGASTTLVAHVYPDDAKDKTVTWYSGNKGVATVTDGTVVATGGGVTDITVRTLDGNYEAVCTVTVLVPVTGISLNKTSIDIYRYDKVALKATVYPNDATIKSVTWSSNRPGTVSVDNNGNITGESAGNATITVTSEDGGFSAQCYVTVTDDGHQAVDLGLSVKWATTNFGTTSTTATGGYYMWGDPTGTATAASYSAPNVISISGTSYDIVRTKWGGSWRIPTRTELGELVTQCTWTKETVSGVSVLRVKGPNGNSIIVPLTGLGYPANGPAGSKQYLNKDDRAYFMSGDSYSDQYGRFAYVYYRSTGGSYNWESYNADFIYVTIRPVR